MSTPSKIIPKCGPAALNPARPKNPEASSGKFSFRWVRQQPHDYLLDQPDPDLETWYPNDDGFDFPLDAVKANLHQWNLEQRANRDLIAPKFIVTLSDTKTGIVYRSNDPARETSQKDRLRRMAEYEARTQTKNTLECVTP